MRYACKCNFTGLPDYGNFKPIVGYEIIQRHYGDVEMSIGVNHSAIDLDLSPSGWTFYVKPVSTIV